MSLYQCPTCAGPTRVLDTRATRGRLRRRRECDNKHRFTTIEVLHEPEPPPSTADP